MLGGRADLGLMALGPDLGALDVLAKRVLAGPRRAGVLLRVAHRAERVHEHRGRGARTPEAEGADDLEARLADWRTRMEAYLEARLHPRLPRRAMIAFYPMSKRRAGGDNWYSLPFEERRRLMAGHAVVGRRYAGRVLQLITGATGLDDWEWGVTLLADDPAVVKDIVYEMRFDEVSARYGEFGPFFVGLVMEPAAALERAGIPVEG